MLCDTGILKENIHCTNYNSVASVGLNMPPERLLKVESNWKNEEGKGVKKLGKFNRGKGRKP